MFWRANWFLACVVWLAPMLFIACESVRAEPDAIGVVELKSSEWTIKFDPATLGMIAQRADGKTLVISEPQSLPDGPVVVLAEQMQPYCSLPSLGLDCTPVLSGSRLVMHFDSDRPGRITWPVITTGQSLKAYILPTYEGVYAPADDASWMRRLAERSPMDTTADLSMPFVGLDYGGRTVTYIFDMIFDNQLVFAPTENGMRTSVTHTFQDNWDTWEYTVIVELGDGSPIAPALAYREYLKERDELVTMQQKIAANPNVERLLGAAHAYLWDEGVFSHLDATDWKGFARRLIAEGANEEDTLGKRIWESLSQEARDAAGQITEEQWPYKYLKSVVATQVSKYLEEQIHTDDSDDPRAEVLSAFCEHFDGLVRPYENWGDGISVKMIDALQAEGLDRMLLCLGDLYSAGLKPQVAAYADEKGYLFGPYDSYHSIHRPDAHPDSTWETAQFGWELFNTGGIVRKDGSMSSGFKKRGYHLSPAAARPYVEKRVNEYMEIVPYSAVFVDCDAYGQLFDDYSPDHPATKQQDMMARLDRLDWLNSQHGLVVGSEGGSAYAAGVIHFAHGMLTPVIGWGDPDLKDRQSPYYKGGYWPPDGPATYIKQVPLKPVFKKFFYDPRYRLPLYEVVFHDSVVATHHWGNASLKFKDQVGTVALLEQLYNVPPLYHLNLAELKKHKKHIRSHYTFFSPLHRELGMEPMTGFSYLNDDRLVQQTIFGDGTRIIANFSDHSVQADGRALPARSVMAIRPDGRISRYTPEGSTE